MIVPQIIMWDWKEYAPIDAIADAVKRVCSELPNYPRFYEVDTGSDQFALVVSLEELTAEQIVEIWKQRWAHES